MNKSCTALIAVLLLSACQPAQQPAADSRAALLGAPDGPLVALVNGEAITEPLLVHYARGRNLDPAQAEQRKQALDALTDAMLLAQDAAATGLLDSPELQSEVAVLRLQHIAARALAAHREQIEVGEVQIMALYEQEKQRAGDTEWRGEHLLFADEASARIALARALAPGTSFAALMAEYSSAGAKQVGELPWSNAAQLPESLVEALRQLEDGEVAPIVLNSPFGWHVLRRLESRPFTPPGLEQVREGARRQVVENALRDYLAGLRAKAEISSTAGAPAPVQP